MILDKFFGFILLTSTTEQKNGSSERPHIQTCENISKWETSDKNPLVRDTILSLFPWDSPTNCHFHKKNHIKLYGGTCATQWQSPSPLYTLWYISNQSGETSTHPQVCLWTLECLISMFLFSAVGLHPLRGVYRGVLTTTTSRISGFISWKTETGNEALHRKVWEKGSTPSGWDMGGSVGMCCTILPVMT